MKQSCLFEQDVSGKLQDCETNSNPTDPRVLMVGFLTQLEKTRRTRQRRGAATLEQLASACQRIVSRRHNQPRKLRKIENMQFTSDATCSQHHEHDKGRRDTNEQAPNLHRDNSPKSEKLKLHDKNGVVCDGPETARNAPSNRDVHHSRRRRLIGAVRSPVGEAHKRRLEKNKDFNTYYLLRWPPPSLDFIIRPPTGQTHKSRGEM